jgi:tRNA (Thr-GGU) A37 N-methylase
MDFPMRPIGVVRSPLWEQASTPIQPSRSEALGGGRRFPEFEGGLQDVVGFSLRCPLCGSCSVSGSSLLVSQCLDSQLRGKFATWHSGWPNDRALRGRAARTERRPP